MKSKNRLVNIDFGIDLETLDEIDEIRGDTPRSAFLRTAARQHIEKLKAEA